MNEQQASPAVFQTTRGTLTADQIFTELHFASYSANRRSGMTREQYARHFPDHDTDTFERRYQRELENAGARIADDAMCPGCGARGFRLLCGACERA